VAYVPVNPWVELKINPRFKPGADDGIGPEKIMAP